MGVECNKDRSSDNAVGYRKIYHNKRTPAARHTSFLFMLASEQVRLAGGKRLEVNTYENCRQIAYRRLRKQSRVENGKDLHGTEQTKFVE